MSETDKTVSSLMTFDVDPEGHYARLHVRDDAGSPTTLKLPTACLTQLLMTLPAMVQMALKNLHGNDSLRLVHSLDDFTLELGEQDSNGNTQFILTLQTGTDFRISFSGSEGILNNVAKAIFSQLPKTTADMARAH
jgi:hypothetical protein